MDRHSIGSHEPPLALNAALFDLLPDAYLVLDTQHRVLTCNRRYLEITGQHGADLIEQSIFVLNQWGPATQRERRAQWLSSVIAHLREGQRVTSDYFRYDMMGQRTSDGARLIPRYWQIKATLSRVEVGRPPVIVMCINDVTNEAKQLESGRRDRAALRSQVALRQVVAQEAQKRAAEERTRLEQALSFARLGAWELDPRTGVITCTDQCKANYGLPPAAAMSEAQWLSELMDSRDRERFRTIMRAAIQDKREFETDYRTRWPDGSLHWILVRGVGRYDEHGMLISLMGLSLDITERKETELVQQALLSAEKTARQQSDHRADNMDAFVSAVSHELRSPLNAIASWTQLLQCTTDPDKATKAAAVIDRNTRQLTHMVDDLLDTGAIINDKLSVALSPVDFGVLASLVAEDIRLNAQSKGLQLDTGLVTSSMVMGDEKRLKQIVWNLLSNALKFSDYGTISVRVWHEVGDARKVDEARDARDVRQLHEAHKARGGGTVVLQVADNGRGIEPDAIGKIFERFRQQSIADSGKAGGLGLGLWLVKNLVERHGGTVTAESAGEHCGATFTVRLPAYP